MPFWQVLHYRATKPSGQGMVQGVERVAASRVGRVGQAFYPSRPSRPGTRQREGEKEREEVDGEEEETEKGSLIDAGDCVCLSKHV